MISTVPLSFLGDRTLWGEDVTWLAEHRAWYTLGHVEARIRWLHLYLEQAPGNIDQVLVRAQLDLAGQDLCSVSAIRTTPQAAVCAAFDLLRDEIGRHDLIAGWAAFFNLFVVAMPALDLGGHRRNQVDHARKAVTWSEMWIGLALVFMAMIWLSLGRLFTDG